MKVAFDIGGVLSKYPEVFRRLVQALIDAGVEIFVLTDMHDPDESYAMLERNGFGMILRDHLYNVDYTNHGEMCKSIAVKKLGIDLFIDDFPGYLSWDNQLGPAPVRLLVQPDPFRPYWSETWKADGDFGRRVSTCKPERKL